MNNNVPKLTHYKTKQEYLNRKSSPQGKGIINSSKSSTDSMAKEASKVDLSQDAKDLSNNAGKKILSKGSTTSDVAQAIGSKVGTGVLTSLKDIASSKKDVEKAKKSKQMGDMKRRIIKKPAIFFISGFKYFGIGSDAGKIKEMSQYIPDAKYFDWDQEDKMLEEIKKKTKKCANYFSRAWIWRGYCSQFGQYFKYYEERI